MASYARLKKQLETLQAQVESARQAELLPIIKRMRLEMATHGISAADLGAAPDDAGSAAKKVAGKRSVKGAGAPKYADPDSGRTWSGFGRAPAWITGARDRTKFLIDKAATKRTPASKKSARKSIRGTAKKAGAAAKTAAATRTLAKKAVTNGASTKEAPIRSQPADGA